MATNYSGVNVGQFGSSDSLSKYALLGTWDPTSSSYPSSQGVDAVWIVSFVSSDVYFSFDGKDWSNSDILIYQAGSSVYQQVKDSKILVTSFTSVDDTKVPSALLVKNSISSLQSAIGDVNDDLSSLSSTMSSINTEIANINNSIAAIAKIVPIKTISSSYTIQEVDAGVCIEVDSGSDVNIVITNSTFAIGSNLVIRRMGVGNVSLSAGSGVTLLNPFTTLNLRAQYSAVSVHKRSETEWCITGDLDS